MTVYLEELSAVSDGARAAIDLAERLRTPESGWCSSSSPLRAWVTSTKWPGCWAARPRSSSIACQSPSAAASRWRGWVADLHRSSIEDQAMTEDEIMRQLSQAVRDDNVLAAEELVTVGKQLKTDGHLSGAAPRR
jgi:hypothetical protein